MLRYGQPGLGFLCLRMSDGNWDVLVRTVDKNTISSLRIQGLEILDVMTANTKQGEDRKLAERANSHDYWCFFIAKNSADFSKYIIYLVLPDWSLGEFQSYRLKQTMFSILSYCNSHDMMSIAFPIVVYKTKNIPLTVSSRLLLQAIGDFSLCFPAPNLQDIRILPNDSCIYTYLSLFLNPIRKHLTESSVAKQSVREEKEQEICAICLDTLYSHNKFVRRLSPCKHVFHEECISKAVQVRTVCPLCTVSLGLQRCKDLHGGVRTHCV